MNGETGIVKLSIEVTRDQAWTLYDLITARAEALTAQEIEAMSGLGAQHYRAIARVLRTVLEAHGVPPVGGGAK
jgi:hypothetical protein